MNIGDFDREKMSLTSENRYLKQILPMLDDKTFIDEANKIYGIAKISLHEPSFNINTVELKGIYKNALLYFRGDARSDYDLNKGLFLIGGTGSGKTIFFEIFKEYTRLLGSNSFVKTKQINIVADVAQNGISALGNYVKERDSIILYIDDFGSGNSVINYFGTNYDVMDELIQNRYDEFVRTGALTHISTNIKPSEFKDRFDARITSRLNAMFNIVKFPINDYRRQE